MRKSRVAVVTLLALCPGVLLVPLKAAACSAAPYRPERLLADADVIVRATALRYAKAPDEESRTTGVPDAEVEFRVEEVLKGEGVPSALTMNGYLGGRDDY